MCEVWRDHPALPQTAKLCVTLRNVPPFVREPVGGERQTFLERHEQVQHDDFASRAIGIEHLGIAGRTDRIRLTASRTAAILAARSVLSTMTRSEHAARAQRLDRLKVEVLKNGPGAASRKPQGVACNDHTPIAKHPVGKTGRRLFEQHEIDRRSSCRLDLRHEGAQIQRVQLAVDRETDCQINVAVDATSSSRSRPESDCVRDSWVALDDFAKTIDGRRFGGRSHARETV
jgi:hypothetical protein